MTKIVKTPYADRTLFKGKNNESLNTSMVFRLLTHMTSSRNVDELMAALEDILQVNFKDCSVTVYELSAARWQGSKNPTQIMCLDCKEEQKPIKLTDSPNLCCFFVEKPAAIRSAQWQN